MPGLGRLGLLAASLLAPLPFGCLLRDTAPSPAPAAPPAAAAPPAGTASPTAAPAGYGSAKYGEVAGAPVIDDGGNLGMKAFVLQGDPAKVAITHVAVEGQPFTEALRAEVKEMVPNTWDLHVLVKNTKPVARGDVLLATFYFRTEKANEESAEGQTEFVFELSHEPWTKSVTFPVRAARSWQQVHVPFQAVMDYPPGEAKVNFRLGFPPQTVEIAALTIENFGRQLALSALPKMKRTYPGMEPDAAWRKPAAERIDKLRKADLTVRVKDGKGKKVEGAEIKLRQTRLAFGLGTCVDPARFKQPDGPRYQAVIKELFNVATLENNLKWVALAGDWGSGFTIDLAKSGIAWLREQNIDVRGHVLLWPGWKNSPKFLRAHEKDPAFLRQASEQRIRDVMTAVKGSVIHWDVVNEPFDNHDILDILGNDIMVDWFKIARSVDPGPKLFINDFAILAGGGGDTPHRAHYDKTIKMLVDKKAPLDGVGIQGHFGEALTSPPDMLKILDRYARFGKPIWITEFDTEIKDEEVTGKFTEDFFTTMFSHPSVEGVIMWGFWDGSHWKNNAPLYRRDWSLKPSGEAFRKLALETWRTNAAGKTGADGKWVQRGFLGDYEVEVVAGGKKKTVPAKLKKGGAEISIVLD
jgi:GH35 family endo-1,4-beta-xylanase